jgi:spoIIIJ-associated protein
MSDDQEPRPAEGNGENGSRAYGERRRGGRGRRNRPEAGAGGTGGGGYQNASTERRPPPPRREPAIPAVEPEHVKPVRDVLEGILTRMGVPDAQIVYIPRTEGEYLEVRGPDLANLIGRHGNTLEALNLIFNNIANNGVRNSRRYYTVDAEGYRARRADQLKTLALTTLERVVREKRAIALEPMLPSERKVIHLVLADSPFVSTASEGVEPDRRLVIAPK